MIFHENTDDEISKYDVSHTPYDNDVHVTIDINGEQEQVQEQSESNMDTTNTPLRGDPTPQKRRSESEQSGGPQRKLSRTIQVPSRNKYYAFMTSNECCRTYFL